MASNTELINSYEMEEIFENYLSNPLEFAKSDIDDYIGSGSEINHFKKKKDMTDEERTARRKKFQKILKIGVIIGSATTLVIFGPEIIAALTPVFPAMKSALAKKGIPTKGLKVGEVAEKFSTEVAGQPIPTDEDKTKRALKVAKNILGFFGKAKERKANGQATALDNLILNKAEETTKKIANLSTDEAQAVLTSLVTSDTADENKGATTTTTKEGKESTGMDMKKYLPIALGVLVLLFVLKK